MWSVILQRTAWIAVAVLVVAGVSAMPAYAGSCTGSRAKAHCYKSMKSAKYVAHKSSHYKRAHHRHAHAVKSRKYAMRRHAHAHQYRMVQAAPRGCRCHHGSRAKKWHGWTVTRHGVAFYHEGRRYEGGTPYGPKMWYNNWEGGFNAAVFWKLSDRNLP